jgi:Leucine-rich repeat (LRR) protein
LFKPHFPPCYLGSIPAELGQLYNLKYLSVSHNKLTGLKIGDARVATIIYTHMSPHCLGSIPAELGQLSKLEDLNISFNQLAGL